LFITHLYISDTFIRRGNRSINYHLPSTITHLFYGYKENKFQPLHLLAAQTLYFTNIFKNYLPPSVTHLTLDGMIFLNKKNCIPSSVTHLTLEKTFRLQSLPGYVPSTLKELIVIGSCDDDNLILKIKKLPNSIKVIYTL